jgi:hypothetical protein
MLSPPWRKQSSFELDAAAVASLAVHGADGVKALQKPYDAVIQMKLAEQPPKVYILASEAEAGMVAASVKAMLNMRGRALAAGVDNASSSKALYHNRPATSAAVSTKGVAWLHQRRRKPGLFRAFFKNCRLKAKAYSVTLLLSAAGWAALLTLLLVQWRACRRAARRGRRGRRAAATASHKPTPAAKHGLEEPLLSPLQHEGPTPGDRYGVESAAAHAAHMPAAQAGFVTLQYVPLSSEQREQP